MARTKRSAVLDTKDARLELKAGHRFQEPLSPGWYLVYRRPVSGAAGAWSACWVNPKTKVQTRKTLGIADDFQDADGKAILTYAQAQTSAIKWLERKTKRILSAEDIETTHDASYTVADALLAYFKDGERRAMKGASRARMSANAWIVPALGELEVSRLTRELLESWLDRIAAAPRRIRTKAGQAPAFAPPPDTADAIRARKDSANRVLSILKAALNFAVDRRLVNVPNPSWQKVKPFKGTASSRIRFLNPDEQVKLIKACPLEFKNLVKGALLTGCRYGELARLQCKDYNPSADIPTIFIAESKNGKPRHIVLTNEGVALFDALTAKNQSPNGLIFTNSAKRTKRDSIGGGWLESDQKRHMKKACETAGLEPISFHELRHTYASMLVNNKCPLPVVAQQLGHSDTRMVEKHYGHLIPSYVADMVRAAMPVLGIVETAKVRKTKTK